MDAKEFWGRLKDEGCLSPHLREELIQVYGDRGEKAALSLEKKMIRKYRDFIVVVGASGEYVVEGDFCTCNDFLFRGKCCWHILAVRLASVCGRIEEYDLWYQDTWKKPG